MSEKDMIRGFVKDILKPIIAEAINEGKIPLGFVCHIEDVFPAMTAQTVKRVTLEADVGERNVVGRTGFLHFFVVLNFGIELLLASELFFEIVNL